jgi:hypothetical protein
MTGRPSARLDTFDFAFSRKLRAPTTIQPEERRSMAKTNYAFERRQRDLAKQKKKEEKRQRREEARGDKTAEGDATPAQPGEPDK